MTAQIKAVLPFFDYKFILAPNSINSSQTF